MATIDLTDPDLSAALDEWAEALGLLSEAQRGLIDDLRERFGLPEDQPISHLHGYDHLVVGSQIRVAGEWHMVCQKECRTDESQTRRLLLVEADARPTPLPFWYECGDGEVWVVAEPW